METAYKVKKIDNVDELKKHLRTLYIIEDYTVDYDTYEKFSNEIRDIVRGCFVFKECREYPVKVKFYRNDKDTFSMELRQFLYNIYSWTPFVELHGIKVFDESYIVKPEQTADINDYINDKLINAMGLYIGKQTVINRYIDIVLAKLRSISIDFSDLMNLTYSEEDFFQMWDNPEYRDIMTYSSPEGAQPVEIEGEIASRREKLITLLKKDKVNPLGVLLRANTGVKTKQLSEFLIAGGLKPTLTGEVMPLSVDNSTLIRGLDRPSYMYIEGTAARKPLILNATEMGTAGYFGKVANELSRTLRLSTKKTFCDTKHLVPYIVRSKKHLSKLVGKYYKLSLSDDDYKVVKKSSTDLIGKTIYTRSVITCNCSQGECCPTCVGTNASLFYDIAEGFGVFLTEEYTKDIEQGILSSKHILTTSSEKIEFTESFHKYFKLSATDITLDVDGAEDISNLSIYIDPASVSKVEEYDDDSTYNTFISTGTFSIVNTETGEKVDVSIKNNKELYITPESSDIMRSNNGYISMRNLDEDSPIFVVSISNNELTKPLYDLKNLIDKKDKDFEPTIENAAQALLDIFVDAGLRVPVVAGEIMLNRLIRTEDDIMKRPNFGKYKMPNYKLYNLSSVLEHNESALVGLGYENLKRQILNPDLEKRTAPSYMDAAYSPTIDMSILKDINLDE